MFPRSPSRPGMPMRRSRVRIRQVRSRLLGRTLTASRPAQKPSSRKPHPPNVCTPKAHPPRLVMHGWIKPSDTHCARKNGSYSSSGLSSSSSSITSGSSSGLGLYLGNGTFGSSLLFDPRLNCIRGLMTSKWMHIWQCGSRAQVLTRDLSRSPLGRVTSAGSVSSGSMGGVGGVGGRRWGCASFG